MDSTSAKTRRAGDDLTPDAELEALVRSELETAVYAERQGSKVYVSLHNLNEIIGTQYGDRVLFELIQNAHDAHGASEQGKISIRLVVRSPVEGVLYVANGGTGLPSPQIPIETQALTQLANPREPLMPIAGRAVRSRARIAQARSARSRGSR